MQEVPFANFRAFNNVYRLAGGTRGFRLVDTSAPLQPVLNLQRLAEIGAGPGTYFGYKGFLLTTTHNSGTASDLFDSAALYSATVAGQLEVDLTDYWAWLMTSTLRVDDAITTFNTAALSIETPSITNSIQLSYHLVNYWNAVTTRLIDGSGGTFFGGLSNAIRPVGLDFPFLISRGSTLRFVANAQTSSGSGTVTAQCIVYYAPIGTLPPGMA